MNDTHHPDNQHHATSPGGSDHAGMADHPSMSHAAMGHGAAGGQGGHSRHAGHSVAMFRDRFWLSLLLTIPVLVWSHDLQEWLGYRAPTFPGSDLIPAVLGTIVFVWGGLVFLRAAR